MTMVVPCASGIRREQLCSEVGGALECERLRSKKPFDENANPLSMT